MTNNALNCTAMRFLQAHENEHLERDRPLLLQRCIDYLVDFCNVSSDTARVITHQVDGELQARHCKVSIDCSRTTSFALFIKHENGDQEAITVAALARLIAQRPQQRLA